MRGRPGGRARVAAATAAALLALAVLFAAWPILRPADGRLRMVVLDVGQGDATVLEAPDGRVALVCGLLRGSFRPGEAITRLRALQRQLANLVAERTRCVQWMQQCLDLMNVQVHRAVTDLTGATGMAIVRAIVGGERDPARLARHRDRRCRKSADEIARYLTGTWRDEHLFNLASALRLFDALESEIAAYEVRLLEEIQTLPPPERQTKPVPPHPNPAKQKAIKARGEPGPPRWS